jgi:hypothetical protein
VQKDDQIDESIALEGSSLFLTKHGRMDLAVVIVEHPNFAKIG